MGYLQFIFIIFYLSCQKENSTSRELSDRNFNFNNNIYHSISYKDGESLIRRKILHALLEENLKIKKEKIKEQIMSSEDASRLEKDVVSEIESRIEYLKLKDNSAAVYVSYPNHLDLYFVPVGISRDKIISQLAIIPAGGAYFSWIDSRENYLEKGQSYYLISASNQELKENDVYFNHEKINIGNSFNEKSFVFGRNQVIYLKVIAEYFEREFVLNVFQGEKIICAKEDIDSGICNGPCEYKRKSPTGNFIKKQYEENSLTELTVLINGNAFSLLDFKLLRDKEGEVNVEIDFKKIVPRGPVLVEFRLSESDPIFEDTFGFDFSKSCANNIEKKELNVSPKLNIHLEILVKGRNI